MSEIVEPKKEKVDPKKIAKLRTQEVEKNGIVDPVDAIDRGFGRVFSKIGKFFAENF